MVGRSGVAVSVDVARERVDVDIVRMCRVSNDGVSVDEPGWRCYVTKTGEDAMRLGVGVGGDERGRLVIVVDGKTIPRDFFAWVVFI